MDEITESAISALRSGVDIVCDHAQRKWTEDMGEEENYKQYERYGKIRSKAKELVAQ